MRGSGCVVVVGDVGMRLDRIDAVTVEEILACTHREERGRLRSGGRLGEGDGLGGTVELVIEVELIGAAVDEQTLVCIHGAELELSTGGIAHKGGHLILVLAKEDAVVTLAHGLQQSVIDWGLLLSWDS